MQPIKTEAERQPASATALAEDNQKSTGLRMFFVLRAINFDRVFEGFLRCALDRGHTIQIALEQKKAGRAADTKSLFDVLVEEYPGFSYARLPTRDEPWLETATRLRCSIDFLRYLEPEFAEAETLRQRARGRAPWYVRLADRLRLLRLGPLRRALDRLLRGVERRMPVSEQCVSLLQEVQPDVVLVSPLVGLGSPQGDYIRAADELGIPSALLVASWDNLTTKGVIRDVPDLTLVWNQDQIREAVDLHGMPAERLLATGAHSHDHWFAWKPGTPREEFAAKAGLAADRPFLLYVCSSGFIAGDDEVEFVREWLQRLRASGDPELTSLGVLIRPHPQNFKSWERADVDEPGRIVVWPRAGAAPTDRESKEDYFHSLYHAQAVIGINTTALVDTAIVRRPVFTLVDEHFSGTQTGTLHFSYLAGDGENGLLSVAHSWDEHFEQLGAALRASEEHRERIESFLRSFVRPQGIDRPAAPLALDAIGRLAGEAKDPVRKRGPLRWTVGVAANALGRMHRLRERLRPRVARKQVRRWRKERARRRKRRRKELDGGLRPSSRPVEQKKPKKQKKAKERQRPEHVSKR